MNNKKLIMVFAAVLLLAAGCDKALWFEKGDYQFENRDLTFLENYDGILIHWDDLVTDEQQDAVREIAAAMVRVEGGTFEMGAEDEFTQDDEAPVHKVTLSDFRIGRFTITRKQWQLIMGSTPDWDNNFGEADDLPATRVTYSECCEFCEKLGKMSGLNFRLPTEAEWEYAACGGKLSKGFRYSGSDNPDEVAWHQNNAGNALHKPGTLKPNELGLYDMSGNVWEWCSDWYTEYSSAQQNNPTGPSNGERRVVRGGSFSYEAAFVRNTQRNMLSPDNKSFATGFRIAMGIEK